MRVILYGYRGGGEHGRAALEARNRRLAVQGGCRVDLDSPIWKCGRCGATGGRYAAVLPPEEVAAREAAAAAASERRRAGAGRLERWLTHLFRLR